MAVKVGVDGSAPATMLSLFTAHSGKGSGGLVVDRLLLPLPPCATGSRSVSDASL